MKHRLCKGAVIMDIYYIREPARTLDSKDAGNKARNDVERILEMNQCHPITLYSPDNILKDQFAILADIEQMLKKLPEDKLLFIQYPLPKAYRFALSKIMQHHPTILLLHDLDEIRHGKSSLLECRQINQADLIISHNKYMTAYLAKFGIQKDKVYNLNLFDYLRKDNQHIFDHQNDKNLLCFAGHLRKSQFIYDFPQAVADKDIFLYGVKYEPQKMHTAGVFYQGAFPTEEIQEQISGKFGLLWDGPSNQSCIGNYGDYLKINNPHKVSMYLSANMPVFVWSKAAIADFIKQNQAGILIDSLAEIPAALKQLTPENYQQLVANASRLGQKAATGGFLTDALTSILQSYTTVDSFANYYLKKNLK